MDCRLGFIMAILTALFAAAPANGQTGGEVSGIWLTQAGEAKVRVSKCGGGICGVVVWLREPINPATGKPQVDDKNPNPALANRPMIGLALFSGMRPSGPNRWSGQIYNADDGRSYASNISVSGPDSLTVEGCVGVFCGGETWTRSAR
jgi:uncharacterized protein (DUF2147 family)